MYLSSAEQITVEWPPFPRLHAILVTRPNVLPPAVMTGVGPQGHKTIHYQPLEGFSADSLQGTPSPTAPSMSALPAPPTSQPSASQPPVSASSTPSSATTQTPSHLSPEKIEAMRNRMKPVSRGGGIGDVLREIGQCVSHILSPNISH